MTVLLSLLAISQVGASPATATEVVRRLESSMNAAQRGQAFLPYQSPDRLKWGRSPSPRPGVLLGNLSTSQLQLVNALLATILSEKGQSQCLGIREEQDRFTASEPEMGRGAYWLAIYGKPADGMWSWRLGGHHVSVHTTYKGEEVTSISPMFFGGEKESGEDRRAFGFDRLRDRDRLARQIAAFANLPKYREMRLPGVVNSNLDWSEPASKPLTPPATGIPISKLDAADRILIDRLVTENADSLRPDHSAWVLKKFDAGRGLATLAVRGSATNGEALYVRLHAGELLIESGTSGWHLHTILRTDQDFGDD